MSHLTCVRWKYLQITDEEIKYIYLPQKNWTIVLIIHRSFNYTLVFSRRFWEPQCNVYIIKNGNICDSWHMWKFNKFKHSIQYVALIWWKFTVSNGSHTNTISNLLLYSLTGFSTLYFRCFGLERAKNTFFNRMWICFQYKINPLFIDKFMGKTYVLLNKILCFL